MGCSATAPKPMDVGGNSFLFESWFNSNKLAKLFTSLTGVSEHSVEIVNKDSSPSGRDTFVMWKCGSADCVSEFTDSEHIAMFLVQRGISSIFFTKVLNTVVRISLVNIQKTRAVCEILYSRIIRHFSESNCAKLTEYVKPYRGGYCANDRRAIEREIFEEKTLCNIRSTYYFFNYPYTLVSRYCCYERSGAWRKYWICR